MGEIVFYLVIAALVFVILQWYFQDSKAQNDEEKALRLRLEDPYIYDPETGAKLTLEEAESGIWLNHNNENRLKSAGEIDTYYSGSEKIIEQIANYLKAAGQRFQKLSDEEIEILEGTTILSKYDNWSYSVSFIYTNQNCRIIFPQVQYDGSRQNSSFLGYQFLFWTKVNNVFGHYYLRNKNLHEKIFDLVNPDDPFCIQGFEIFTIQESKSILPLIHLLKHFENEENLEMEINGEDFFIKSVDEPSQDRFLHLENKIKTFAKTR